MIDFESLLFNIDISTRCIPRAGSLLVAEPFLRERYFHHAVICLVDYEPRGSPSSPCDIERADTNILRRPDVVRPTVLHAHSRRVDS